MKILFQGDSITDAGRNTNAGSPLSIGQGYPIMIDGYLSVKYPNRYTFENLGISGNRVVDLYARVKADIWNRGADVLSVLIGVNDVWHEMHGNGVEADRFYNVYSMLVKETLERFPNMKMILMEPFALRASATQERWEYFSGECRLRAEAVKRIARENGQFFLPLQERLNEAEKLAPADYWLADGVHPTAAGHQLIANAWLELFEKEVINEQKG